MKVGITAFSTSILFTIHEDTLTSLLGSIKQPREPSISCLVTTSYTPVAQRHAHNMSLLLSRAVIVVDMLVEQCFCILSVHLTCGCVVLGGLAIIPIWNHLTIKHTLVPALVRGVSARWICAILISVKCCLSTGASHYRKNKTDHPVGRGQGPYRTTGAGQGGLRFFKFGWVTQPDTVFVELDIK